MLFKSSDIFIFAQFFFCISCIEDDCSRFHIDSAVLKVTVPEIDLKSSASQVFNALHGNLNASRIVNPKTGVPCYEWACQSPERQGEACTWCLPSVFLGGFSKCGTTALCDKLATHPSIRVYGKKEVNIFSKLDKKEAYSNSLFEQSVAENIDANFYNRIHKMTAEQEGAATQQEQGDYWLDCSAGAFRDINAAAQLLKHNPLTKIIMIVRDPWQNMGSRISMSTRRGRTTTYRINALIREFKKYQFKPSERFTSKAIAQLAMEGPDFVYAEKLLYWQAAFPSSLLVLDQYDLQHQSNDTMHRIEMFLNLPHHLYPISVLQSVSHNANRLPSFAYDCNSSAGGGENIERKQEECDSRGAVGVEIHKPYSFEDQPLLYKLSKVIFSPSLCLFEKVFGWKIHITTESEQ